MSTVHICLKDIFGVAVACNVIFYPEDTPFANGTALAVSGAHSILIDADGNGSVTLLPGRYTVRFAKITGNTDTLIILVPTTEGAYELPDLICSGNWALPMRDFLLKSKNFADVVDPASAFAAIKQTATVAATGAIQLATQAEVDAGTNASKAVTPATLVSTRAALSGKADATALAAHASRTDNPHAVTKALVGLGNVDNTSDANKPISTATQAALDTKASLDSRNGYLFFGFNMQSQPSAGMKLAYGRCDASGVDFRLYSYTPLFLPTNSPTFRDVRMIELSGTYWITWTRDAWNYSGSSGVGLAYSTDLIHWTQAANIPTTVSSNGALWSGGIFKEPGITDYTGIHVFWTQGAPGNSVLYESHPLNASLTSWSAQAVCSFPFLNGPSLKVGNTYIGYNDGGVAYTAASYLGPYTAAPQYNIVPAGWAAMKLEAIPGNVIKLADRYRAFIDNSDPIVNGRTADLGPAGTATNCYYCDSFDLLTWSAPIPFYPGDFLANGNIIPIPHAIKSALDAQAAKLSLDAKASKRVYKSTSFTADAYGRYQTAGTVTVTDPTSPAPVAGDIYEVIVASGTAVVGGVTYTASRVPVVRVYIGSAWVNLSNVLTDNLVLNGTHNTAPNQVGVSPNASDILIKSQADVLYAPTFDHRIIRKTASESRINTTTLANDAELSFSLVGGKRYRITSILIWNGASSVPGIVFGTSYTGSSSLADNVFTETVWPRFGSAPSFLAFWPDAGANFSVWGPYSGVFTMPPVGWARSEALFFPTTSGTASVQWAQKTSSTDAMMVQKGSYVEIQEF